MAKDTEVAGSEAGTADDAWVKLIIAASREMRERLKVSEEYYTSIFPSASSYGRDFYLYGVLDLVERACFSYARIDESLDKRLLQDATNEAELRVHRNYHHSLLMESAVATRKLVEALAELINFSETNEEIFYRHYLLKKLEDAYRRSNNYRERFYSRASINIERTAKKFVDDATELESQLDRARCWYLRKTKTGRGSSLAPFDEVFDTALAYASPQERIGLGLTYDAGYSRPSKSIHWSIGSLEPWVDPPYIKVAQGQILVLCSHVLLRCRQIHRWRNRSGAMVELMRLFKKQESTTELYKIISKTMLSRGDFVIVQGELAEVLEVAISNFSYRIYRVRFLSKSPLPDVPEDWYTGAEMQVFFRAADIKNRTLERIAKAGVGRPSRTSLSEALRRSALRMWSALAPVEGSSG